VITFGAFDPHEIRKDFPILESNIGGKSLVYLDNPATTQKPSSVIWAISDYYREYNANIHRAIHTLGEEATKRFEVVRGKVAQFINARSPSEIIFTSGTTASINLVALGWGLANFKKGDQILLSEMEHHANLVPWQMLAKRLDLKLEFVGITDEGKLALDEVDSQLDAKNKLVAITHISNVLGTVNPVKNIVKRAQKQDAAVLIDAAQSISHLPVDVQDLGCDFLVFSAHKMLGPTGVGVLYIREELQKDFEPVMFGGEMIRRVKWTESTWNDPPHKFEPGTPHIAGVIGLGAAIDYLNGLGMVKIRAHDQTLVDYALKKLSKVKGVKIYGPSSAKERVGVINFTFGSIHAHDVAQVLDGEGIAVRSGHHCAMPLHELLGVPATVRIGFSVYNTKEDINRLVEGLEKTRKVFGI
jgi:cysteine desulfurase/selenocysteine lyase